MTSAPKMGMKMIGPVVLEIYIYICAFQGCSTASVSVKQQDLDTPLEIHVNLRSNAL